MEPDGAQLEDPTLRGRDPTKVETGGGTVGASGGEGGDR